MEKVSTRALIVFSGIKVYVQARAGYIETNQVSQLGELSHY